MANNTQQGAPEGPERRDANGPAVLSGGPLEDAYDPNLSMDLFKDWRRVGQREEKPGQNTVNPSLRKRLFGL